MPNKTIHYCAKCRQTYGGDPAVYNECPECRQPLHNTGLDVEIWRKLWPADKNSYKEKWDEEVKTGIKSALPDDFSTIPVTTMDLKEDYNIIGPVYFQINNRSGQFNQLSAAYEQFLSEKTSQMSHDKVGGMEILDILFINAGAGSGHQNFDRAFFIAVEELKKRAALLGADAIIGFRQDIDIDSNGFQYFYLQVYGTAVKMKNN